jgi:hypothetical protein
MKTEEMKMSDTGCSLCGSTGIHACPGQPIGPWPPEKVEEFRRALDQYPPEPKIMIGAPYPGMDEPVSDEEIARFDAGLREALDAPVPGK